jgi:ABC-type lipoprotein export system ATPase subunit
VIDQPEDHLDSAFIYDAVVKTLRKVKERRQVIVATHNANIAVLGGRRTNRSTAVVGR